MDRKRELHIVKQVRAGNKDAYRLLVDEYAPRIISFVKGLAGSYADAEDIAQEVFVKGFFSIDKYRGEAGFYSWLYRIAYNETITFLRKKNKKSAISLSENFDYQKEERVSASVLNEITEYPNGIQIKMAQEQKFVRLKQAIALLDVREQFLITQFYYRDASIKQLSEVTGDSESNVKVKLFRIKKKLGALMVTDKIENRWISTEKK